MRSLWVRDAWQWVGSQEAEGKLIHRRLVIVSDNGYLLIDHSKLVTPINEPAPWAEQGITYSRGQPGWRASGSSFWNRLGFRLTPINRPQTPSMQEWLCIVPQW